MAKKRVLHRSSETGRTVTPEVAAANPKTTVAETDTLPDKIRLLYGCFSLDLLLRMQEQLTESGNPVPSKAVFERVLKEVIEAKRG